MNEISRPRPSQAPAPLIKGDPLADMLANVGKVRDLERMIHILSPDRSTPVEVSLDDESSVEVDADIIQKALREQQERVARKLPAEVAALAGFSGETVPTPEPAQVKARRPGTLAAALQREPTRTLFAMQVGDSIHIPVPTGSDARSAGLMVCGRIQTIYSAEPRRLYKTRTLDKTVFVSRLPDREA